MAVTITISKIIHADRDKIYKEIQNVENFPKFMRDVKEIKVIEKSTDRVITEWKTDIDGVPIQWVEEDVFDNVAMSCRFQLLRGDYRYDGLWELKSLGDGKNTITKLCITANFDWEVPNFEKYVGNVLEKKARGALRGMLNALKKRCDG